MNQLFIELYLDEDVDVRIADLVRARGYAATTTQEAGNIGIGDEEQLAYAVSQQKAFLTHNRDDFERLVAESYAAGKGHYGIIIAVRRSPYELVQRLFDDTEQHYGGRDEGSVAVYLKARLTRRCSGGREASLSSTS